MASIPPASVSPHNSNGSSAISDSVDPRVEPTVSAVNWDALAAVGMTAYGSSSDSFHWGDQIEGGYNLVRYLHLHNESTTVLVVRVPLLPIEEHGKASCHPEAMTNKLASEVATMQYVERFTSIPVPHVYCYSSYSDPNVGSPYIVMSRAEGVPLVAVWHNMEDDRRRIVLSQVVDIMLELWAQRFETEGCLFRHHNSDGLEADSKENWYTRPTFLLYDDKTSAAFQSGSRSHPTAAAYWLSYANARLKEIKDDFGFVHADVEYMKTWFLRSIVPEVFDTSLDEHGYPLAHGDFHSQNIMIVDADSSPRITCIIDWEMTSATYSSTFAQYPFFIVDHPLWEADHPLVERNVQDQATFNELLFEKERHRSTTDVCAYSSALSRWKPVYCFHQVIEFPRFENDLYPTLFLHIFGDVQSEDPWEPYDYYEGYYRALRNGVLKNQLEQFESEYEVAKEAREVLGDETVQPNGQRLKREEFRRMIAQNISRFDGTSLVQKWYNDKT